jgi:hypothetical protein
MTISYKPEVIADGSGKFCGNALVFATKEEAETYVIDLAMRWTAVRDWRVVETDAPATYHIVNGRAESLDGKAKQP